MLSRKSFFLSSTGQINTSILKKHLLQYSTRRLINSSTINNNKSKEIISIYPNPANDIISVELPINKSTIEIMNFNGQIVKRMKSYNSLTQIDISDLKGGIYLIKVADEKGVFTKKFIKL